MTPSVLPLSPAPAGDAGIWQTRVASPGAAVHSAASPDAKWDLLLVSVAGYILTAVGRVHQLFPVLEVVHPALVAGLLAAGGYLIDRRQDRRSKALWVATTKWLMVFFAWMVLSIPGGINRGYSFDLVFGNFIKTVLMYAVVAGAVRGGRDVERLTGAYLLGAAVYAAVVLLRFDVGSGDDWRLGRLFYYDANDFATFAVTAMPFGLYFAHRSESTPVRLLAMVALAVLSAAFVKSGSRGGFLALAATGGFIMIRYRAIPFRARLGALALVAVVLLGTASDRYWQQMGTIASDTDYNQTAETGRLQIWSRGVGYMLQNPVFGVGANNFGPAEGTLSPLADRQQFGMGVRWSAPHNSFVQVGAELGVPGLIWFIAMIASAFVALRRSETAPADPSLSQASSDLTQALTASLLGFVVGAFFLSLAYSEILYTLLALAVGVQKLSGVNTSRGRQPALKMRFS